jgi:acyl-CoA thioesterase-1
MKNLITKISSTAIVLLIIISTLSYFFYFKNYKNNNTNLVNSKNNLQNNSDKKEGSIYKIISFGDSLTAGYGLNLEDSYPIQLEKKLLEDNYEVDIVNAGISGETSFGNVERAEFIKNQNPDMVVLGIGGNDALRGLDVKNTKENIEKTIDILQSGESKIKVILLKMQSPNNLGVKYKNDFDAMYENISKSKNIKLVPFIVGEVFLNQDYMLPDGIHPNKQGYKVLIDRYIYPEIVKMLK